MSNCFFNPCCPAKILPSNYTKFEDCEDLHSSIRSDSTSGFFSVTPELNDDDLIINEGNGVQEQEEPQGRQNRQLLGDEEEKREIPRRGEFTFEERWSEEEIQACAKLWLLSDKQLDELRKLKGVLADVDHWINNPYNVVRFLTGPHGFDEKLFRDTVKWRETEGIDDMVTEYQPPEILRRHVASGILEGYDKDGDPIYLERAGVMDVAGFLRKCGKEASMDHFIWLRELALRGEWHQDYEQKMGHPPKQVTILYDLQGLSTEHMRLGVLPFFGNIIGLTTSRYFNLAKRIILIRAPTSFTIIWGIVQYCFGENAKNLMVFAGNKDYLTVLDRYIDREVLPSCALPEGKGRSTRDFPPDFDGGGYVPK